ncbi:hypothetical protein F0562_027924 [Nyssa sinensis]|uniref:Transcription factor n=1 Tax=Nyssa sinensis TaxID=561372 RepID=A0A5J5B4X7_9ASTE|nr:hypothetical protein F0562_027924 [Nyssa sinensis]
MGRAPCCDKANVKKGPWSPEEDAKLKSYIEQHGTGGNWIALPQKIGLKRCGKSCRLRWLNYLRPNIKHGGFSEEEDNIICSLYISIGSRWSIIAAQLPGRTDNDIKNYWNTRLKKKLLGKQRKEQQARRSSCLKQEMRKTSENSVGSGHNNSRNNHWPELPVLAPVPYSNQQEPCFNDHASIRKLLIKLGGRFSGDNQSIHDRMILHQLPINTSSIHDQPPYEHSINVLSAAPVDALDTYASQELANAQNNIEGAGLQMFPSTHGSFPAEFEGMIFNNPQRLDGMEFLYEDMVNNMNNWGGTSSSSLVFPPAASNCYEGLQQGMLEECTFDDLRYAAGAQ